jgi:FkbM family methyltransferase
MFSSASNAFKRRAPALHGIIKWAYRCSKLPAVKFLNGKLTLVAPELISLAPTEPHVLRWIDRILRRGDTFFDVGAHYGWMSLAACHCVGKDGKVVAFEPSPSLVKFLQYHEKANGFDQMEIVSKAVADSDDQTVPFYILDGGESFMNSLVNHRTDATSSLGERGAILQVQTTTLDRYCAETRLHPNAVKIDVEGAELMVLRGGTSLLKECRAAFIVAVHPTWLPEGQQASEIFELFRTHGYAVAASEIVRYEGADFGDYVFLPSHGASGFEL